MATVQEQLADLRSAHTRSTLPDGVDIPSDVCECAMSQCGLCGRDVASCNCDFGV
jgi:hypothetical protein